MKSIYWLLFLSGCTGTIQKATITSTSASPSPTTQTTTAGLSNTYAASILFLNASGGSFDTPPSTGTSNAVGFGLKASRVFNPDGSLLATAGSTAWPSWLSSVEIGISGSGNAQASNPNCATFASQTESTSQCRLPNNQTFNCGATAGQYRISEVDCISGGAISGNGGPTDGIYIRAVFNRSELASSENILVSLQYSASFLNAAPSDPSTCFSSSGSGSTYSTRFSPVSCSDFVWNAYLKRSTSDPASGLTLQPFFMLIPPPQASLLPGGIAPGLTPMSRQIILPLASDPALSVFQLSRLSSFPNGNSTSSANLIKYCTASNSASSPANSALCAGVVFYSLNFYRM